MICEKCGNEKQTDYSMVSSFVGKKVFYCDSCFHVELMEPEEKIKYVEPNPAIGGWMGLPELEWLFEKAKKMDSIVEVGSWMGRSTHALLSGCKGIVYAVDHFKGSPSEIDGAHALAKTQDIYSIFKQNVSHFSHLIILRMDSSEAVKLFKDKEIDMVFIDADHEYPAAKNIMEEWLPKCVKLFCGHDFSQGGTPRAFKELNLQVKTAFCGTLWSIEL